MLCNWLAVCSIHCQWLSVISKLKWWCIIQRGWKLLLASFTSASYMFVLQACSLYSCWVNDCVCCRQLLVQWRLHMYQCLHGYLVRHTQAVGEAWQEVAEDVDVEKTVATLASLARQFALCRDRTKVDINDFVGFIFVCTTTTVNSFCSFFYHHRTTKAAMYQSH